MTAHKLHRLNARVDRLEQVRRKEAEVLTGLHKTDAAMAKGLAVVSQALHALYALHQCDNDPKCPFCEMHKALQG